MSLSNIKRMADERGFTIVELLIVIVIIGILAAIVIVAYSGITSKANDSSYQADAASIAKATEGYNADSGSYPLAANVTSGVYTAPAGVTALTTSLPANVYIVPVTAAPTATTLATSACTTASTWAVCKLSTAATKYYAVWLKSAGACIYYLQTAGTAAVKNTTAGSPGTC